MKQGKLLAKDILPLLGKEFSAMARTGGALDVALNSLNTTSQRMSTSFRELVNRTIKGVIKGIFTIVLIVLVKVGMTFYPTIIPIGF